MAWELCSKQDVIMLQSCREDELQDQWSEMVESMIRQHLGAPYLGTTQAVADEYHSGDGSTILKVRCPPILSVTSLKVNTLAIDTDEYVVFPAYVQLRFETFPKDVLNVVISYTSGGTEIDPTVKLAATAMVIAMLNYYRRMGADSSLKWGDPRDKQGEEGPNLNIGLTSHLQQIMKRTLRRNRVRMR